MYSSSVLTIGEIRLGIERLRKKDGAQAELLERWLHGLHHTYGDHIVNVETPPSPRNGGA